MDPETAGIARSVFESYLKGSSLRQIARDLTAAKLPPAQSARRGNKAWASQTVGRILKNPVYRGVYVFGEHERVDGKTVRAERGKQIEIPCPRLVSDREWSAAQARLAHSAERVRNHPTPRRYPLRGRVVCRVCARSYVGQWNGGRNRREYRHRARDGGCSNYAISAEWLERRAIDAIAGWVMDPDRLRRDYERAKAKYEEQYGHIGDMIQTAQAELAKQQRKLDKLTASYIDPAIGMTPEYVRLKDDITKKIAAVDSQLAALEHERGIGGPPPRFEDLETWSSDYRMMYRQDMVTDKDIANLAWEHGVPEEVIREDLADSQTRGMTAEEVAGLFATLRVKAEVDRDRKKVHLILMGQPGSTSVILG